MGSQKQTVTKIPVIDFSKDDCLKPGTSSWLSIRKDVCSALEELGCFTAILPPTKVPVGLENTFFASFHDLFSFPFPFDAPEKPFRAGYATANTGQRTYGIMNGANPEETREFTHHFWPNGNDQFRESADLYAKVMVELDHVVTKMVFENYGVEKYHEDHVESTFHNFKMIEYKEPQKSGVDVALLSHTDKNFSTIIQQNHVNGLEVHTEDDDWLLFEPPLPSSVIYIAGDGFQVWSNDRIRPSKHRVTLRENEVRYVFGVFCINKGMLEVPKELVDKDHPLLYKPLNYLEFLQAHRYDGETEYAAKAHFAI